MAKILVMLYTTLRKRIGVSKLELEGTNVGKVIDALCDYKKPDIEQIICNPDGTIKQHFVLTLNSEILDNKTICKIKVKSGDILHVFPPVSGG